MIVFVHGVPETDRLWDAIRAEIDRPSVAVALPGFGSARPDGFGSSKDEYAEWLLGELAAIGEPIDLVGHDWGAGLTYRIAGDPSATWLRSWAADVANIMHPHYVWHDFAAIWQTEGDGEAFFEAQLAQPVDERAATFELFGVPAEGARALASWLDEEMAASILALYRSATPNPYSSWGDRLVRTSVPGLVLHPTDDPFGDESMAADVAQMLGARMEPLPGLGHWWQLQDPGRAAAVLTAFWDAA
jgi:pimeloyl-ACP methyl ester carboxylesterase